MDKKLLITIDTEALPARASNDHVKKLIWGDFENGRAGIIEICNVIEEVGGKGLFFLDVAGSFYNISAYREINSFLTRRGHMVEWHYHPEILGKEFWIGRGVSGKTMRQDIFDAHDAEIIMNAGYEQFIKITGRTPTAYRAGSFRWNGHTIDFLARNNVRYSFNACRETSIKDNYNTFEPVSSVPFNWESGVREIPCGEIDFEGEVIHFRLPRRFPKGLSVELFADKLALQSGGLVNILLHSWSLLDRDKESGHFFFKNHKRLEDFRRILEILTRKMPIISGLDRC